MPLYLLTFTLCLLSVSSCLSESKQLKLYGRIAVKGSEPFTYLTISTDEAEYRITGPLSERLLNDYQGQLITLRGYIEDEDQPPPILFNATKIE